MTGAPSTSSSERRLVGARERIGGSFDQECRIETPTGPKVPNGAGGSTRRPRTVQDGVPCEVRFPAASPKDAAAQQVKTTLTRVEIRLPVGTPIDIDSVIHVDDSAYEVQGHDSGRSFATEVVCDCLRVGDGK